MADPVSWALGKIKQANDYIWNTSISDISRGKSFLIRQLRIIVLAARGFMKDRVQLRASALTLYTMLSIIPFAAIAFGVAKGFALDQKLQELLIREFQNQPEVLNWILKQAGNAMQATRGGYIAGVGLIILVWSVISLLDQIENSFNHIWQIQVSRPWLRKFTDYIAILLIAPVVLVLSSSLTVFVTSELYSNTESIRFIRPIVGFIIKIGPYVLTWIGLTILFIIMPNTKVKFIPAFVSGVITGTILQLLQWLYIDLQFGISKLSAIYGSFAAIPLFIIWVQASWIILLLGAELAFANQNVTRFEFEYQSLNVSQHQKKALSLMIMKTIVNNFTMGEKALSSEDLSRELRIPVRLVRDILQDLTDSRLVSVIHEEEHHERLFQPAMDVNKMTVSFVLSKLERKGSDQQLFNQNGEYDKMTGMLDEFEALIAASESNILINDL
ncbi:MAG TPA: YihY/virulence factor BrkB family protein [Bacteroidales bacterium]|nr:YihY/virulence factor BrkB family protein [Bacteroidales bacterium]HOG57817.1 YihY/virulence factor BrkB family protein [Bacteroidales bacterium]HPX44721.1 YihY/virulence factor BrkB family protein [Bacteroidales bacterium]